MRMTKLPKVLSLALRQYKPLRKDINLFKEQLSIYLNNIAIAEQQGEHEENFKKYLADFLKNSLYQEHLINTKERIDLAIYSGKDATSPVSVLIEVKRPSNTAEFLSHGNINKKALQELLLYYLRERIENQNNSIKQLIATNGQEWYVFKGEDFYTHFYKNTKLLKEYKAHRDGEKDSTKNELFYKEIAAKYIAELGEDLDYVYFNLKDYQPYLALENKENTKLVTLYKFLSSTQLLNKPFGNDNNQLNKQFYGELLHIIGLEEHKEKGKKIIRRLPLGKRDNGSLLESAIFTIEERDYLHKAPQLRSYGNNKEEQLFNIGLELCLTWINRILFIKLLESQLLGYHHQDKNYRFLNADFMTGFDDLEALFFSALAKKKKDRNARYQQKYQYVPYLNSSLFEPNKLEDTVLQISNIKDEDIKLYSKTVLKDNNSKRLKGKQNTLIYLFDFLEAYDFSSANNQQVEESEQSKTLISASVLGLIFEKINGYKDGSFYTPSYITMYMSRETLRRAVIEKINLHFDWKCSDFEELKEDLKDYIKEQGKERPKARLAINKVVNSLRICDPAVGSGHFLVSCLNELIAIKSELKILCDALGQRLDAYIHIDNDELIITDQDDQIFAYNPAIERTLAIQKALFHEKQNLIENCLFAVDINPNSVKICRLRLWIELLKSAYYNNKKQLQTLPNIDINIKCGNSLISRFGLEDDLKSAFKNKTNPYSLRDYKKAVKDYKQTNDKQRKREIQRIIDTIKSAFSETLDKKFIKKLAAARGKYQLKNQEIQNLKAFGSKVPKKERDSLKKLKKTFEVAQTNKEDILNNVIYQNAFEWRFEFPEVLDNKGNFKGFDVVIGNPPYIKEYEGKEIFDGLRKLEVYQGKMDIWYLFGALGLELLKKQSYLCYIASNNWVTNSGASKFRNKIIKNAKIEKLINFGTYMVFDSASIQTMIMLFKKDTQTDNYLFNISNLITPKKTATEIEKFIREETKDEFFQTKMIRENWIDKTHTFNRVELDKILDKIKSKQNFYFLPKSEIAQGIVAPQDFINKKSLEITKKKVGVGIFNLSSIEKQNLNLQPNELALIKPFFTSSQLNKYYGNNKNTLWVIYTDSSFKNTEKILPYPNIKKHLDKFKKVITSDNKPYGLHRSRNESFFKGEKINSLRKCTEPTFTYTDFDCYTSQSYYIIKTNRISLKYLTGVLNSKLFKFWFKYKGKMQGAIYQIDKEPLLNTPIIKCSEEAPFVAKVNEILAAKAADSQADTSELEKAIDVMVYQLYGLTYEEVLVIDKDFAMSETDYVSA